MNFTDLTATEGYPVMINMEKVIFLFDVFFRDGESATLLQFSDMSGGFKVKEKSGEIIKILDDQRHNYSIIDSLKMNFIKLTMSNEYHVFGDAKSIGNLIINISAASGIFDSEMDRESRARILFDNGHVLPLKESVQDILTLAKDNERRLIQMAH